MKLEFEESPLHVERSGFGIPKNQPLIQEKINKLLKKVVAVECKNEAVEYLLPIIFSEKTDGTLILILNLKNLYNYLEYKHL